MQYETVIIKKEEHIATVVMNRPPWNPLNDQLVVDLIAALEEVMRDDELRVMILTGMGKAFSSGADLKSENGEKKWGQLPPEQMRQAFRQMQKVTRRLLEMEIPTIAMVNGDAIGGGMDFALACDLRTGSEKTRFKVGFITRGSIPVGGGSWFLPRLIGLPKTYEILFTEDFIDGKEAEKIGLLNYRVASGELEKETMALAQKIAKNPPIGVKMAKLFVRKGLNMDVDSTLEFVANTKYLLFSTEDHKESIAAYREKRTPFFRGR